MFSHRFQKQASAAIAAAEARRTASPANHSREGSRKPCEQVVLGLLLKLDLLSRLQQIASKSAGITERPLATVKVYCVSRRPVWRQGATRSGWSILVDVGSAITNWRATVLAVQANDGAISPASVMSNVTSLGHGKPKQREHRARRAQPSSLGAASKYSSIVCSRRGNR